MKKNIITITLTLLTLAAVFLIYISTGSYNISQLDHHNAITKKIISITTHSSIDKRMKEYTVPGNIKDSVLIIEGFKHYDEMCVGCHGAPGEKPDEMTEGLYPKPPQLFKHVEEDDAQEFFWIIKNGIKMTSMPAYGPTHNDDKIWAITAFVTQKLGKMTADEYKTWTVKHLVVPETESTDDESQQAD